VLCTGSQKETISTFVPPACPPARFARALSQGADARVGQGVQPGCSMAFGR